MRHLHALAAELVNFPRPLVLPYIASWSQEEARSPDIDSADNCLVTDRPGCLHVLAQPSCFGFLLFVAVLLAAGGIADLAS